MKITRNRTIRPSSRAEKSKSYKVNTKDVLRGDQLIVNIDHESKAFQKTFIFNGSEVADRNSISFRVRENGNNIEISWSGAQPTNQSKSRSSSPTQTHPKQSPSKKTTNNHKLESIAELLAETIDYKFKLRPTIITEYKPDWLVSYPTADLLAAFPQIAEVHASLTDQKVDLHQELNTLNPRKRNLKQSFDLWIDEPFNFAVEFDESQHFNQYRLKTLDFYSDIKHRFPLSIYRKFCSENTIDAGKSGFQKLKSHDPLFPELLKGDKQDNRIRQRAFRDYLKDFIPLSQNFGATLRIPYQIIGKIKDFNSQDLKIVANYIHNQKLI